MISSGSGVAIDESLDHNRLRFVCAMMIKFASTVVIGGYGQGVCAFDEFVGRDVVSIDGIAPGYSDEVRK